MKNSKHEILNPKQYLNSNDPNSKRFGKLRFRILDLFRISDLGFRISPFSEKKGITMLLVVAILSAIMSISLSIFNIIFDQVRISGEIADSFLAFYSADQGIEKNLYLDRITNISSPYGICSGEGDPCYSETSTAASAGGCYDIAVKKLAGASELKVLGQYPCGAGSLRTIKRGFNLTY